MVRLTGPLSRIYSGPMTGADFLQLSPAAAPARGLTGWLADAIRAAIMDGRLRAGTPLPATRLLAGDLGVSRGVIVEAYQRLADEGLVSARPGAGTRVLGVSAPLLPAAAARRRPGPGRCWCRRAGGSGRRSTSPPACPTCPGSRVPPGCRAERAVLEQASVTELGYGDPRGSLVAADRTGGLARAYPRAARRARATSSSSPGWPRRSPCWPGCCGRRVSARSRSRTLVRAGPATTWPTGACGRCRSRSTSTGCGSASWPAGGRGRRCSRPRTSSPPGSCWPRSAAATCWTGPPRRTP